MKKLVTSYTFDASEKTITSTDFTSHDQIQLITNVTDNVIIYNFADPAKGGSLAATVLTLDYDTTSMADADALQIFIEDGIQLVSESTFDTKVGSLTETAPANDTASSGLNGRLQRIAQRITSLIALLPAALGQSTMANSFRVAIASDQSVLPAGGNVAHDAADSGNPVKIGAKAKSSLAGITLVAADDRTDSFADIDGISLSKPYSTNADIIAGTGSSANTSDTAVTGLAGGAANVFAYITSIQVVNTSASNALITFKNGNDGAVLAYTIAPAAGGSNLVFPTPLKVTSANTTLHFSSNVSASTIYVSAQGFKSKA